MSLTIRPSRARPDAGCQSSAPPTRVSRVGCPADVAAAKSESGPIPPIAPDISKHSNIFGFSDQPTARWNKVGDRAGAEDLGGTANDKHITLWGMPRCQIRLGERRNWSDRKAKEPFLVVLTRIARPLHALYNRRHQSDEVAQTGSVIQQASIGRPEAGSRKRCGAREPATSSSGVD